MESECPKMFIGSGEDVCLLPTDVEQPIVFEEVENDEEVQES